MGQKYSMASSTLKIFYWSSSLGIAIPAEPTNVDAAYADRRHFSVGTVAPLPQTTLAILIEALILA